MNILKSQLTPKPFVPVKTLSYRSPRYKTINFISGRQEQLHQLLPFPQQQMRNIVLSLIMKVVQQKTKTAMTLQLQITAANLLLHFAVGVQYPCLPAHQNLFIVTRVNQYWQIHSFNRLIKPAIACH